MAYGIELSNSDGSVLFSSSEAQYGYYGKTVSGVGSVPTGTHLSFQHNSDYDEFSVNQQTPGGIETIYYFVPFSDITNTNAYGLEIYDSSGNLIWHTSAPPLILWADDTGTIKPAVSPVVTSINEVVSGGRFPEQSGLSQINTEYAIDDQVRDLYEVDDEAQVIEDFSWSNPVMNIPVIDGTFYDGY